MSIYFIYKGSPPPEQKKPNRFATWTKLIIRLFYMVFIFLGFLSFFSEFPFIYSFVPQHLYIMQDVKITWKSMRIILYQRSLKSFWSKSSLKFAIICSVGTLHFSKWFRLFFTTTVCSSSVLFLFQYLWAPRKTIVCVYLCYLKLIFHAKMLDKINGIFIKFVAW